MPGLAGGFGIYLITFTIGLATALGFTIIPYLAFMTLIRVKKLYRKDHYVLLGGCTPIFACAGLLVDFKGGMTVIMILFLIGAGLLCGSIYYKLDNKFVILKY